MKNKRICLLITLCMFLLFILQTVSASQFMYSAQIQNKGSNTYKAVRLPIQVVSLCQSNLADLKILDNNNQAVPYFVNQWKEVGTEKKMSYKMELIYSFVKDSWQYYDYGLTSPVDADIQATSITVTTTVPFAEKVTIFGSHDNLHWSFVQSDLLYFVEEHQKMTISFNTVQKFRYYRLQVPKTNQTIRFTSFHLYFDQKTIQKKYFVEEFEPAFHVEELGRKTVITLLDMKNIIISNIMLVTDDMFQRNVSYNDMFSKELYNLSFTKQSYQDLSLDLHGWQEKNDESKLVIENLDDAPVTIQKIIVKRYVQEVVFEGANANSFTLLFGNTLLTKPPTYDIMKYKEDILLDGYDLLSLGAIQEELPVSPSRERNFQWFFNGIIVGIVILVGGLLLFKLKKHS